MRRPSPKPWIWLGLAAVLVGGCSPAAREKRALAAAERSFADGQYDQAEIDYGRALKLEPADPLAIGKLGLLYSAEGRTRQAVPFLKKAAELSPAAIDVQDKLGAAYLELGAAAQARATAKQALAGDPADEQALLVLVESGRTSQDAAETRQFIEQLRQSHPDCAGYHLALGTLQLGEGKLSGVETELRKAIELDPKSAEAYLELGNLFALRRDKQQAGEAFASAAHLSPLRSNLRLRYLDFLVATGQPDAARTELAQLTAKAPDYIPGLVYAMKLALVEKRYADCGQAIQAILQRDPQNYDALLERSALKSVQGDSAGAIAELTTAEGVYPRSPQIKYQLALAYLKAGDLTKAEDRLNQALVLEPGFDQAKLVLAELDLRRENPAAVVAPMTELLQSHPQLSAAYLLLARAYAAQANPDLALATYRRMATAFPRDPQAPYLMGLLFNEQRRRAEARAAFERAEQITPNYLPAVDMLVNADLTEGKIDAAATRVRGLLDQYPKSARPWLLQAKVDLVRKDLDATEADLQKVLDLDPTDQAAYFELAQVDLTRHKPALAVERLTALADRAPSPRVLMQLAQLHASLSQFEAARADYEKLLAFDPKFGPALNDLAYLDSEHLGKLDVAYDLAKRAREAAPDDPDAADTLGWILYRRGDFLGALDLVQECAQREPENTTVQYHLGMVHYMLGEEPAARQALERAAAGADAATGALARQRLALLAIDPAKAGEATFAQLQAEAKADPKDPIVLERLAAIEARRGSAALAAEHYEALIKLTPKNPQVMLELAQLYAGPVHDPDKARALAKLAHELAPSDARVSAMLGRLLFRTGDYQWSTDLLQEAARNLPADRDLPYDLAQADYSIGRLKEAQDALDSLPGGAAGSPESGPAKRLAAMLAASRSPAAAEAARAEAQWVLAEDPTYLPALMVSALALEQEDHPAAAAAAYEKILAQDPAFTPATRQLALLEVKLPGEDQRAYDLAVKAHEAFPDDPGVTTALGIVTYRRGDYSGAVNFLRESLRRRSDDPVATFYLGLAHFQSKDFPNAKAELQRAIDLHLTDPEASQATQVLAQLGKGSDSRASGGGN